MDRGEVNELIMNKVDDINEQAPRKFIRDLLRFERSKMDQSQPRYKDDYHDLIEKYVGED